MTQFPLEQNPLFQKVLPEVINVASGMPEFKTASFNEHDAKSVTQHICEERNEDALEFWMFLSDIEKLNNVDDWSDANGCIENMIRKHMSEKNTVTA